MTSQMWAVAAAAAAASIIALTLFAPAGLALPLIPPLIFILFISAVLSGRRILRSKTQKAIEILIRHPRKILTTTAALVLAYAAGLFVVHGTLAASLRLTLEVLFAITSPADALPKSPTLTHASLAAALGWIGWMAVASWAITVPALVAIVIDDATGTLETGNHLKLSTDASRYLSVYSESIAKQTRALIAFYQTPGLEAPVRRDEFIKEQLKVAALIAQSFVSRRHRSSMNASYSILRSGPSYERRDASVLYDMRNAGLIDHVLEVVQWARPVPALQHREPILLAVDQLRPVPGGPAAIVRKSPQIIENAHSEKCWRQAGMADEHIGTALQYFESVPFRSFISIPVTTANRVVPHACLTVQADTSGAFRPGTEDAEMLLKQLEPCLVLLGSVEEA